MFVYHCDCWEAVGRRKGIWMEEKEELLIEKIYVCGIACKLCIIYPLSYEFKRFFFCLFADISSLSTGFHLIVNSRPLFRNERSLTMVVKLLWLCWELLSKMDYSQILLLDQLTACLFRFFNYLSLPFYQ